MTPHRPGVLLTLNGRSAALGADRARRLSTALREDLGLTGTKVGCDAGDCGACTVLLDGAPVCACLTSVGQAEGHAVTTVEGLGDAGFARLQRAFLRHGAAQCGICTPGMLMAAAALLAEVPRPTPHEAQEALGGVLCRCTGYARIIAAVCDATDESPGHPPDGSTDMPETGRAVGARVPRLDGAPKVDGTDLFGADHWQPGGVILVAVRSPHHRASFRIGDTSAWAAARGNVAAVFAAADIPGTNCFGALPAFADQPVFAVDETRFRGEAVALVAFEDDGSPTDLSGFPVEWTELPAVLDPTSAATAPDPLHAHRPGNLLVEGAIRRGDATTALARSAHVVQGRVQTAFVEHAYIEPEAGAAWLESDTLVIRASTQAPALDREETAKVLGLQEHLVRIIPSAVGGGFGSKLDVSLQPLLGLAVLSTGRPARMIYTRWESMTSTTKRHPAQLEARIGCDADGRLTALDFSGVFDTGAYASWGPTVTNRVPVHATGPYRTPHVRAAVRAIHTNGPVAGAFRGFGVPQAAILQETLFDRLAEAVGLDRLAFRRLNALQTGDATATGQVPDGVGIGACLEALQPHWDRALADAAAANVGDPVVRRGVGIASCWYGCGNTGLPNPSTIRIGIAHDGRLVLHQGATDIGQGSNTVIAQIAADALGVPLTQLELIGPDTGLTPDAGKTSASRQTYVTGRAALAAGQALRAAILRQANAGDGACLRLEGGALVVSDGGAERVIDLAALPADPFGYALSAQETYDPPTVPLDADGQGSPYAVYGYGAQVVELAVDTALGTVDLLRITAAHDVGRAINPQLCEGQIEGGIAQGIGLALMEEYIPGRTENLHDYLIPTTGDMPTIVPILIEVPDSEGPMGAKGLGEHVLIPTAPAILNAIRHATGAEINRLPALPHRVREAILAVRAEQAGQAHGKLRGPAANRAERGSRPREVISYDEKPPENGPRDDRPRENV